MILLPNLCVSLILAVLNQLDKELAKTMITISSAFKGWTFPFHHLWNCLSLFLLWNPVLLYSPKLLSFPLSHWEFLMLERVGSSKKLVSNLAFINFVRWRWSIKVTLLHKGTKIKIPIFRPKNTMGFSKLLKSVKREENLCFLPFFF